MLLILYIVQAILQPNIAAQDSNTTWTNITRVLFLFKIHIIQ
jgi:hypothetical protein